MSKYLVAACLALLFPRYVAQQASPKQTLPKVGPCDQTVSAVLNFDRGFYTTPLGEPGKPLKVSLVIEDRDGADSYRFAVAEVIRTYFPTSLAVDSTSDFNVWVSGTKEIDLGSGSNAQSVDVRVVAIVGHHFSFGDVDKPISGNFTFAETSQTMVNYPLEHRAQAVREMTYKALSDFFEKWNATQTK
jgi:hypothetical protein